MTGLTQIKLFAMIALVSFGLLLFAFSARAASSGVPIIGQVVWVSGAVKAVSTNNVTRVLERRSPIYEHDTIVTDASGSGQIVFTDSSTVALRNSTTYKIDQYNYNKQSPNDNKYVSTLVKGGFRTITGLISKGKPDSYEIKTPVATIGVRGTEYSIFYSEDTGLQAKLDAGAIFIANQASTLELNKAQNQSYASVTAVNQSPQLQKQPSPVFKSQPALQPATAPAPATGPGPTSQSQPTGGATPPSGSSTDGTGGTGTSSGGTGTSSSGTETSTGGSTDSSTSTGTSSGGTETSTSGSTDSSSSSGQSMSVQGESSSPTSSTSGGSKTVSGFCVN